MPRHDRAAGLLFDLAGEPDYQPMAEFAEALVANESFKLAIRAEEDAYIAEVIGQSRTTTDIPETQYLELTNVNSRYCPAIPAIAEICDLTEGCRIIYRDRDGRDWPGVHRFTLDKLASITLDEPGLTGSGCRKFRIDPSTLCREPAKEIAHE